MKNNLNLTNFIDSLIENNNGEVILIYYKDETKSYKEIKRMIKATRPNAKQMKYKDDSVKTIAEYILDINNSPLNEDVEPLVIHILDKPETSGLSLATFVDKVWMLEDNELVEKQAY